MAAIGWSLPAMFSNAANKLPPQRNGIGVATSLRQLADLLQQLQGIRRLRSRERRRKIERQHQSDHEPNNDASVAVRHRAPILLSKARGTSTDVALGRHHDVAQLMPAPLQPHCGLLKGISGRGSCGRLGCT